MLDKMLTAIVHRLDATAAAVMAKRQAIEKERASGHARDHAGREFLNSEGYTTPLPKAAQNAQNEYARARRAFEKADLAGAISTAVTMMVARERRNESAVALKMYLEAEDRRQIEGVHPEVKPLFARMFAMGIEPRMLPYVREKTLAIVCDILMWDGHDPDMLDPASPMPAIFDLYASRLIVKPVHLGHRSRSKPDAADQDAERIRPDCYKFNKLARSAADALVAIDALGTPAEDKHPVADCEQAEPELAQPPEASVPVALDNTEAQAATMLGPTIPPELSAHVAEAVFDADPINMSIYWPRDIAQGEYGDDVLIPALERMMDSDRAWTGAQAFLDAARRGEAKQFIDAKRTAGIARLVIQLEAGEERAIEAAQRFGFTFI